MNVLTNYAVSRPGIIVQIGLMVAALECALWTYGRTQVRFFVVAIAVLLTCVLVSRPRVKELGIGLHGMAGASVAIPIALIGSGIGIAVASQIGTLQPLYGARTPLWHGFFYAIWAFEQQFMLNSFFYHRFERLMGNTTATAVVTALLFSFVHVPNPVLVPATFLGGLFFVFVFRRWRNIYPLAIAHAILGLTLAMTFPDSWIRHMRVGIAFFRFHVNG
jgi:hypothetical protein